MILLLQIIYTITVILLHSLVTDHLCYHYDPLVFSCCRSFILSLWSSCILLLQIIYTVAVIFLVQVISIIAVILVHFLLQISLQTGAAIPESNPPITVSRK